MCDLQAKEENREKRRKKLSIFELESKHDNLECEDEKLIWKQFIKQKLCPLKHDALETVSLDSQTWHRVFFGNYICL